MTKVFAATVACLLVSSGGQAKPSVHSGNACKSWYGRYEGRLSETQTFSGDQETVRAIVTAEEIYVSLAADSGGAFDADATTFKCTNTQLRAVLHTGAGGKGRISLLMTRGKRLSLKLSDYKIGIGPSKALYLPNDDKFAISMRRAHF